MDRYGQWKTKWSVPDLVHDVKRAFRRSVPEGFGCVVVSRHANDADGRDRLASQEADVDDVGLQMVSKGT